MWEGGGCRPKASILAPKVDLHPPPPVGRAETKWGLEGIPLFLKKIQHPTDPWMPLKVIVISHQRTFCQVGGGCIRHPPPPPPLDPFWRAALPLHRPFALLAHRRSTQPSISNEMNLSGAMHGPRSIDVHHRTLYVVRLGSTRERDIERRARRGTRRVRESEI